MVKLRLMRRGMKKFPSYRIIAKFNASRRDGEFLHDVGFYNPSAVPPVCEVNEEKVLELLKDGAIPTETVLNILKEKGIMKKFNEMTKKTA